MSSANVAKIDNVTIKLEALTIPEREKLQKARTGHGNLVGIARSAGIKSPLTIRGAIVGNKLKPDNLGKLRSLLQTIPDEQ